MTVVDWAQVGATLSNVLALLWALFTFNRASKHRNENARKTLEAQKIEIYQRLEIESNAIFKFEAENKDILPLFKSHLAPKDMFADGRHKDADGKDICPDELKLVARKYYENCCNLFEVSARLRSLDIVDHEVFGSWVAWYFDTTAEWGFRALWNDLRDNYTAVLRENIFDGPVAKLIAEWDLPRAAAPAKGADAPADHWVDDARLEAARRYFYGYVGDAFNCDVVRNWLGSMRGSPLPAHPQAYR